MSSPRPAIVIDDRVMVPHSALDHAGYREWVTSDAYPQRLRTTFVVGEVLVEMTPESIGAHNQVKRAVTTALDQFVRGRDLGRLFPDGALLTNAEAGLSCEPDLTFVSWTSLASDRVRLVPRAGGDDDIELMGSPDLVVEVVSDSSVRKDTRLLRDAYARAGVREYWLIDARGDEIQFEILSNAGMVFRVTDATSLVQESHVLPGSWSLTRERDRDGRFTYSLERTD